MNDAPPPTWVHLVLAGGGVLTLSYAGAIDELHRNGVRFRSVSCCSAGTFVGALLCARGTPEGLIEDARRVPLMTLRGRRASFLPDVVYALIPGLLAAHPLLRWPFAQFRQPGFVDVFQDLVGGDPAFKDLKIRFATAGFDIVQRRFLVYASDSNSHPDMRVSEALSIAVSIPLAYPPHERGQRIVLDAAVASECPVWMAADQDPSLPIVALRPLQRKPAGAHPRTIEAYLSNTFGSALRGMDDYIMTQMPRVKLMEIDCGDITSSRFDLSRAQREDLISAGRRAAQQGLRQFGNDLSRVGAQPLGALPGEVNDDKALKHGHLLMTRFHQDLSNEVSNRVFISYSRHDKQWCEKIKEIFDDQFPISSTWDDSRIEPGERWEGEVQTAINASRIAIFLLSKNFFQSRYIMDKELPAILTAAQKSQLMPMPLFVGADDAGWAGCVLNAFQAINLGRPLDSVADDECRRIVMRVGDQIKRVLQIV